ncbi:aldehyde:ferredoxin oxidoreductase [Desulfocicer vacuolatum DSM 3385]|uniref:Aldehyde:ferredoxin oxidoreductase n=1 Tax=Desulfocicer vacuolatum DSM 3385 TaxID=1121400 RepID=A0A1W2D5Q1_9BACT|nr:aldehyde ferredoxin oxidoreductase family protein [Desulfocicer vacuolatum]SMC92526.1 aldehyde:ferredoxin oxidoreductase [Desulfocicer vacuolatum DSM 3385]
MTGYMGKVLMVNLSDATFQEQEIADSIYEKYLSGAGLGGFILYNHIPADADPLGPDNMLGFVSGLLTGTGSLFTGRWMVMGKSPLTGGYGEANCGGNFSPAIKRCGFDAIFFKGISEKPVYLYIKNGRPELKDASHLWGKDAIETEEILIAELKKKSKPRVACIGAAGEKMSCISGVSNDRGRMAARSGLGAVMGSKKLKAVVLDGKKKITPHNRKKINELSKKCNKWVQFQPRLLSGNGFRILGALLRLLPFQTAMDGMLWKCMLRKWGTIASNQYSVEIGDSPIKNWGGSNLDFKKDQSHAINPDKIIESEVSKYRCFSCPLGCGGICKGKFPNGETHKPEYESIMALSGLCLNDNMESVFQMNDRLNRAGMDTISAGGTIAFAIECYEMGILTKEDTGGLELKWGDPDVIMALLDKMIAREGIGDILADGVKKASEKIGKSSEKYAVHAGGQELPMHDSRFDPGFALHYAVEANPGRHTIGSQLYYEMYRLWKKDKSLPRPRLIYRKKSKYKITENKAVEAAACSKFMNILNCAGGCVFGAQIGVDRVPFFEWLNAATGWDKTPEEYLEIGDRLQSMKQAFNLKHGIDPQSVRPHTRAVGHPPQTEGANKNRSVDIDGMIEEYWRHFNWDPAIGKPPEEKI